MKKLTYYAAFSITVVAQPQAGYYMPCRKIGCCVENTALHNYFHGLCYQKLRLFIHNYNTSDITSTGMSGTCIQPVHGHLV